MQIAFVHMKFESDRSPCSSHFPFLIIRDWRDGGQETDEVQARDEGSVHEEMLPVAEEGEGKVSDEAATEQKEQGLLQRALCSPWTAVGEVAPGSCGMETHHEGLARRLRQSDHQHAEEGRHLEGAQRVALPGLWNR
jgi:hypothetical protein